MTPPRVRQSQSLEDLDPHAWVSIERVAAHYDRTYKQVWGDVKAGNLPHKRIGRRRVIRIRVKDALAWGDQ